jgi:predicted amidophosphoribosyltransferase
MGEHSAKTKSQRSDLLQPVSVSRTALIERFFDKIKQCRRVATGYGKLAANYLTFIKLASIRIRLRANESRPNVFKKFEARRRRAQQAGTSAKSSRYHIRGHVRCRSAS